jgi:hypothetical protein
MQLAGVVFQACSIDRSDISPFRINNLQSRTGRDQRLAQVPTLPEPDRASLAGKSTEEWRSRLLALARPDRTIIARLIATSEVLHRASAGHG